MDLFILSSNQLNEFQIKVLETLFNSNEIKVVGVCIDCRKKLSNYRRIKMEFAKGRGGYVFVMIIRSMINNLTKKNEDVLASEYFKNRDIPIDYTKKLYSEDTIEFIRDKKPDCIYRTGFGIIREPLLTLAPKGMISFHHGNLRRYRGQPFAFWELYNNEDEMSVTVQILNEKLDAGKIVKEIVLPIYKSDTWGSLKKRAHESSCDMILDACMSLNKNDFDPQVIPENKLGKIYTNPNLRQWFFFQFKIIIRKLTYLWSKLKKTHNKKKN